MKNSSINAYTFVLTGLFSLVSIAALSGCQTIKQNPNKTTATQTTAQLSTMPTVPITPKVPKPIVYDEAIITFLQIDNIEVDDSHKFPELPVDSLNRYDWQLVRSVNSQGVVSQVTTQPPLMLEVRPSNLVFKYDCQRYSLHHDDYSDNSYSSHNYNSNGVSDITPASCLIKDTQAASDISSYLINLFPRYSRSGFSLELLSVPQTQPTSDKTKSQKTVPYELAINAQDKKLVFAGTLRELQPTQGLPISYEFLKVYKWRLVSALDSDSQPIIELSRLGFPVTAYFGYSFNDEQHVGFSSDCNGVGGPYILTLEHILLIGSGNQTMMGCGPKREAAEDKIRALEQSSQSQLNLQQLENTNIDNTNLPYYLLTQKLETGETLIWKNTAIVDR